MASAGSAWPISCATQRVSIGFCRLSACASSRHFRRRASLVAFSAAARAFRAASSLPILFCSASSSRSSEDSTSPARHRSDWMPWNGSSMRCGFSSSTATVAFGDGVIDAGCHGAITDKAGVRELRDYLTTLRDAARARYDAGLSWIDAAEEIVADHFTHWIDRERVFINVNGLYREFSGEKKPVSVMKVYEAMADWYWHRGPQAHAHAHGGACTDH